MKAIFEGILIVFVSIPFVFWNFYYDPKSSHTLSIDRLTPASIILF